jgi:hypothetical protein
MSCKYTPYTVAEIKDEIKRVTETIQLYSGMSRGERIRNGNDEFYVGDYMDSLAKELAFWQSQLKIACVQEGGSKGKKFFVSGIYGC